MARTVNPSLSTAGSSSSFSRLSAPSPSSSSVSLSSFPLQQPLHVHPKLIMCTPPKATIMSSRTADALVDVPALKAKTRPETDSLRLWEHYLDWIYQHNYLVLYMDVSRIVFSDEFVAEMDTKFPKNCLDMVELEGCVISNPDEKQTVGHYWLRKPELAPTVFLKKQIEYALDRVSLFAADIVSGKIKPPPCPAGCFMQVLSIGIGESALGPQFVAEALAPDNPPFKVPFSILQQSKKSWAMHICFGLKCLSKRVERHASALKIVQVAFNDLVKHALRFYLCFKSLWSQLREPEIFKSFAAHDWVKLISLLHQNVKRKTVIVILGSVMAGILIMVGAPVTSPNPITWALTEENLIFLEAWRTIDRAYIDKTFNGQSWFRYREEALRHEPMNNREQTYAAIRKMLMTLEDPFTRFLEPEKFNTLRTGTRGAVTGVGLEVGFESNGANADLVVIAPVIGGPAERAGIVPGDIISEIDGMTTNGLGLYDAAQRLQGPEDSEVKLTVQKKQSGFSNTIMLVREKIKINPVSWRLCEVVEEGKDTVQIGYIRLATFNENASRSIKEAIQKLKESGATAYILDMRNNSGGLFPAGIEIAKMWLEKGVIVYITDSRGIRDIYEADGYGTVATDEPLAVLVNKGTASASEILAGALKDNKRATILGEPTFGKGKIQSVFELSDGSGMAVTVARYETPAHVDIDKVGITPDHPLPASIPSDKEDFCRCLIDSSLPCHMPPSTFFPN